MSLAKKKQTTNIAANAMTALISRERSSIRCSISGALVASISFSSSSRLMPACLPACSSAGPASGRLRRRRCRGGSRIAIAGCGRPSPPGLAAAARRCDVAPALPSAAPPARPNRAFDLTLRAFEFLAHVADRIEIGVALRLLGHLVDLLLEVGHLGFAHRLVELALELRRHAPELAGPLPERTQCAGQFLRADRDQRDHADDEQFAPADVEHRASTPRCAEARSLHAGVAGRRPRQRAASLSRPCGFGLRLRRATGCRPAVAWDG